MLVNLGGLAVLLVNRFYYSFYREWLGGDFVILFEVDTLDFATQVGGKLTIIQLADNHAFVLAKHLFGVLRQRIDVVEMR